MLVEKVYTGETFVRYGRILAAEYDNQGRLHTALHFKDREANGYYAPSGESLRRSFLKSPLEFTRITSAIPAPAGTRSWAACALTWRWITRPPPGRR